ncbi:MAG TPA: GTPase Era [bacterium]
MTSDPICGAVAVLGKPNVGKSTFMNKVLGQKLAIVSPRPQTTRGAMAGIYQDDESQIVFYDTPGIHQPKDKLSKYMISEIENVIEGAEVALFLVDVKVGITDEDRLVAEWLKGFKKPIRILLNKIDQVKGGRVQQLAGEAAKDLGPWIIRSISAAKGTGVNALIEEIKRILPHQPPLFPEDELTDKSMREIAAEMIREQCFLQLKQEIPYGVAAVVEKYEEKAPPHPVVIGATLYVEKESQKGILIGTGGKRLKSIGTSARVEIEKFLGQRVFLELWVKVSKDWRKDEDALKRFGYQIPKKGSK